MNDRDITAREAHEQLGVPRGSIRAWAHSKRLFPVGIEANGTHLYRLADVVELAATTKRRTPHVRARRVSPDLVTSRDITGVALA